MPADLPENWLNTQTIAAAGADVGLSKQHGYNYLMQQVNAAQNGVNLLGSSIAGLTPATLNAVPTTRKVNGLPLTSDINLTPEDIGVTAKRTCIVVGTSTAGWTEADCDFLCDGVDDQVEIQEALDSMQKPFTLLLLPGTYHITAPIEIKLGNTELRGFNNATILQREWIDNTSADSSGAIECKAGFAKICNLRLVGIPTVSSSYDNNYLIKITGNNCICDSLYISGSKFYGIRICNSSTIINCTFSGLSVAIFGVSLESANIYYNSATSCTQFVHVTYVSFVYITYNRIRCLTSETNSAGIIIQGDTSKFDYIGENIIYNAMNGITIQATKKSIVSNNVVIRGSGIASDYPSDSYTIRVSKFSNNTPDYNLIIGNFILGKNYVSDGGTSNTFVNNKYN